MMFESKTLLAIFAVCLCLSIGASQAQENAQFQIPPSLVECYNTSFFMNRDNRLPANIDTLISLIEKVENSYGFNMDMRQLATSLLYRFRQDGIQRAPGVSLQAGILPYSPTGFQFPKFRLLLTRLLSNSGLQFPNSTLTSVERCSLHFMLSSTFDTRVRGDESQVCNNLAQYRADRLPRSLRQMETNFLGDVEVLDSIQKRAGKRGIPAAAAASQRASNVNYDYDSDWAYAGNEGTISQCPVEDGVVRTKWGTINAGTLLAGIATGLQQQGVGLQTLLALGRRQNRMMPQTTTSTIDNRWAATLAGDLAEVALVQMPVAQNNVATVGAIGSWNDTVLPHWYFLSQRTNLEDTDAEIRGGLDGIIIAKNIVNWRTQASNLKLSQLLRMYYSLGGVLNSGLMACNRRDNFPTYAPSSEMQLQTSLFAQVLDQEMQLKVTLSPATISNFSQSAASALITYVPLINTFEPPPWSDISNMTTIMTNIYVFIDTFWPYRWIADYVAYVLQNLNIHPYASTVTLLSAYDGSVMVNTTSYITDLYQQWNITTHSRFQMGFNLPRILSTIQNQVEQLLAQEAANEQLGGHSLVALIIPSGISYVDERDYDYCMRYLFNLNYTLPGLNFIYYTGGAVIRFKDFVNNPSEDLFYLDMELPAEWTGTPVVNRIRQIPRRISNPRCNPDGTIDTYGANSVTQYARLGTINFYRLDPQYFENYFNMRYLKIVPISAISFTVCTSRILPLPFRNATQALRPEESCEQTTTGAFSYDLTDACEGYDFIPCPPFYFSVQAQTFGEVSCTEEACQTPDQAQYSIYLNNLSCRNTATGQPSWNWILLVLLIFRFIF